MITDKGTGLERIQREAFLVLFNNLNAEIDLLESAWATLDEELATATGFDNPVISLESVENINFHLGHRPSLIEAPITRYPNVSVMAYQATPAAPDNLDHYNLYTDRLFVEVMVKSERYQVTADNLDDQIAAERIVNARIQRTTDAVNNVITSNGTLNGTVTDIGKTPSVVISDVFVRSEKTSYGNPWLWQGSRLEYDVSKVARLEDRAGLLSREGLTIDQI